MIADPLFPVAAADVALTNDEWYTPRWLFDAAAITFDLDVCAPVAPESRTCPALRYLTVAEDGLTAQWDGIVWMNPPYSRPAPWVDRWANHPEGLALLPSANSPWRAPLLRAADGIALLTFSTKQAAGDQGFMRPDGGRVSYPFALVLAARGASCRAALGRVAAADVHAGGAWFVRGAHCLVLPLLGSSGTRKPHNLGHGVFHE